MPTTQTAGGNSAQPYGMYLPMQAAGHHNMIHQPIHQVHSIIIYIFIFTTLMYHPIEKQKVVGLKMLPKKLFKLQNHLTYL